MRETSADRAAVPDRKMSNVAHRFRNNRKAVGNQCRRFENPMPRQSADRESAVVALADVLKFEQPAYIDDERRSDDPEIQHGRQTLPTRHQLGVIDVGCEHLDGLVDRVGTTVVKRSWFHGGSV